MGNHLQLIRNQGFYTELYNSNNDQAMVGGGINSE